VDFIKLIKMKTYSRYHQRIISNRVFKFLELAGFEKYGDGQYTLKLHNLLFRAHYNDESWSFYLRTGDGKMIDGFACSESFSAKYRNEKEIGLFIIDWIYTNAHHLGQNNERKIFNEYLTMH